MRKAFYSLEFLDHEHSGLAGRLLFPGAASMRGKPARIYDYASLAISYTWRIFAVAEQNGVERLLYARQYPHKTKVLVALASDVYSDLLLKGLVYDLQLSPSHGSTGSSS